MSLCLVIRAHRWPCAAAALSGRPSRPDPAGCPAPARRPPGLAEGPSSARQPGAGQAGQPEQRAARVIPGFRGGRTSAARSEAEYLIGRERRTAVLRRPRPRPLLLRPHEPRRAFPGRGLRRHTSPHRAARRVAPRTRPRGRCCPVCVTPPGRLAAAIPAATIPAPGNAVPAVPGAPSAGTVPAGAVRPRPLAPSPAPRPLAPSRPVRFPFPSVPFRVAGPLPQFGSEPGLVRADDPVTATGQNGSQRIAPIRSPARRDRRLQRRQPGTVSRHLGQTSTASSRSPPGTSVTAGTACTTR